MGRVLLNRRRVYCQVHSVGTLGDHLGYREYLAEQRLGYLETKQGTTLALRQMFLERFVLEVCRHPLFLSTCYECRRKGLTVVICQFYRSILCCGH